MTAALDPAPTTVRVVDHGFNPIEAIPAAECIDIQPGSITIPIAHPLAKRLLDLADEQPKRSVYVVIDTALEDAKWRGQLRCFRAIKVGEMITEWSQIP